MLRVLIIEDSAIVRERLIAMIDQLHLPIRVAAVADGLQAVLRFEKLCPDAVVLDIELPGLNGFDLLAQFKLQRPIRNSAKTRCDWARTISSTRLWNSNASPRC
jgi:CheY-like chemotaxis protein